jgi:hypothetical protein
MSTQQRNSACLVSVDPSTVEVLRRQTLVVLEANHYFFEELPEFGPEAQFALSVIYRDAFAVHAWAKPCQVSRGSRSASAPSARSSAPCRPASLM